MRAKVVHRQGVADETSGRKPGASDVISKYDDISCDRPVPADHRRFIRTWYCGGILGDPRLPQLLRSRAYSQQADTRPCTGSYPQRRLIAIRSGGILTGCRAGIHANPLHRPEDCDPAARAALHTELLHRPWYQLVCGALMKLSSAFPIAAPNTVAILNDHSRILSRERQIAAPRTCAATTPVAKSITPKSDCYHRFPYLDV